MDPLNRITPNAQDIQKLQDVQKVRNVIDSVWIFRNLGVIRRIFGHERKELIGKMLDSGSLIPKAMKTRLENKRQLISFNVSVKKGISFHSGYISEKSSKLMSSTLKVAAVLHNLKECIEKLPESQRKEAHLSRLGECQSQLDSLTGSEKNEETESIELQKIKKELSDINTDLKYGIDTKASKKGLASQIERLETLRNESSRKYNGLLESKTDKDLKNGDLSDLQEEIVILNSKIQQLTENIAAISVEEHTVILSESLKDRNTEANKVSFQENSSGRTRDQAYGLSWEGLHAPSDQVTYQADVVSSRGTAVADGCGTVARTSAGDLAAQFAISVWDDLYPHIVDAPSCKVVMQKIGEALTSKQEGARFETAFSGAKHVGDKWIVANSLDCQSLIIREGKLIPVAPEKEQGKHAENFYEHIRSSKRIADEAIKGKLLALLYPDGEPEKGTETAYHVQQKIKTFLDQKENSSLSESIKKEWDFYGDKWAVPSSDPLGSDNPNVKVEGTYRVEETDYKRGDQILLISDGIEKVLSFSEMQSIVVAHPTPEAASKAIMEEVKKRQNELLSEAAKEHSDKDTALILTGKFDNASVAVVQ